MEFAVQLGFLAIGLTALYFGAEWLVRGSAGLAFRFGISSLVVGLTVVAFGTSAPELFVTLQLNIVGGRADAAVGNVIGSNICNLALILGISAALRPIMIHAQIVKREMPILLVVSGILAAMLWNGYLSRAEGIVLALGICAYTYYSFAEASREKSPVVLGEFEDDEVAELRETARTPGRAWALVGLVLVGLILLTAGAKALEIGALGIARRFGISEAVIGLTLLAVGTSLPELATSIVATLRGQGDIIIGNAVGSSIFNILLILGASATARPMTIEEIEPVDLGFMIGVTLLSLPLMWTGWRLGRREGIALLAVYAIYCYLLFQREQAVPAA